MKGPVHSMAVKANKKDSSQLEDPRINASGVLSRDLIRALIQSDSPIVVDYLDLELQLQPNGFDLTLAEVHRYQGRGVLTVDNAGRQLPSIEHIAFGADDFLDLDPGIYHVLYNEAVRLPNDLMALARPRSSLNRSGVTIHSAVWDAGYTGRSTSLLAVLNPAGFRIQRNARVLQLVFFMLADADETGYRGVYQGENLTR
jgi:dUTP pyrophosphatase